MLTQEQQLAVTTVDENVLVSAGAGSGKTHVLVERYVEILRRYADVSLANIIAVTYTKRRRRRCALV
jgi:ATP-dependent exoDNAse (exonuclease V) beta subunit (contains helicase and exonuclease domains)